MHTFGDFIGLGTGRVKDTDDQRDWTLRRVAPAVATARHRKHVDLTPRFGDVLYQNGWPECVAFMCGALKTFHERADHRRTWYWAVRNLYTRCKKVDGIPHLDGTYIRVALELLRTEGIERTGKAPAERDRFTIDSYARIHTLDEVLSAISAGRPVCAGIAWDRAWDRAQPPILHTPLQPRDDEGHAVLLGGYDLPSRMLIGRNHWSKAWGNEGNFLMPFAELERQLRLPWHLQADLWTVLDHEHITQHPKEQVPPL